MKVYEQIFNEVVQNKYIMQVQEGDQTTIKPDKEAVLVEVQYDPQYREQIEKIFSEFETIIYYRSVYGETDVVSFKGK